jgi:hypothetical protein
VSATDSRSSIGNFAGVQFATSPLPWSAVQSAISSSSECQRFERYHVHFFTTRGSYVPMALDLGSAAALSLERRVAQRIEPNANWFFDSISGQAGNAKMEKKDFEVASYGRQLGPNSF